MALGDDAIAEGMAIVDPNADRRQGADDITRTRDYVAQFYRAAKTYASGLVAGISTAWADITGKPTNFPSRSDIVTRPPGTPGTVEQALNDIFNLASGKVSKGGDTITGHLFLPNSAPATAGYTAAFINNDGRVSKGASSIRYKDLLADPDIASLGDIWPRLREFTFKGGDGKPVLGYIAEELAANPAQERFVVYATAPDGDGVLVATDVPESIDFLQMLMAMTAQLHAENVDLRVRVEALEAAR